MQVAATAALVSACREVGLEASREIDDGVGLAVVGPDGEEYTLEIKGRAVASTLPHAWLDAPPTTTLVLVGDVVTGTAREQLRARGAGWLDRRGHLHLPGLYDGPVNALPRPTGSEVGGPLAGRGALEVAVAALLGADEGIRSLARAVGLAASTVSAAARDLRQQLLLTTDGRPVLPDLFEELANAWQPDWRPLGGDPSGRLPQVDMVVGGDVAAAMRGAPVVVSTATPTRYYVESERAVRLVLDVVGPVEPTAAVAWVAVSPSRFAFEVADEVSGSIVPWVTGRIMSARVSAVELAGDPGRGREVLKDWQLPEAPWSP